MIALLKDKNHFKLKKTMIFGIFKLDREMIEMKRIGFVVAIHRELQEVFNKYGEPKKEIKIPGYEIFVYELFNKEIFIIHSGCGNIASSSATQVLISLFNVEVIFNFGVVGGLDESLFVNDVIIVEKVIHYDFDTSVIDLDMAKHQYQQFDSPYIETDKRLLELAKQVNPNCKFVVDASGDHFVDSSEEKKLLHQEYGAGICEMEAAGIVITCHRNNIPCLLIKAVSDDVNCGGNDFKKNVSSAANKAVELIFNIVEKM